MKTFKLKPEQEEKDSIEKVEVDIDIVEQVIRKEPITLEQIDQEIGNLQERIDKLQSELTEKQADRILIEKVAKEAILIEMLELIKDKE